MNPAFLPAMLFEGGGGLAFDEDPTPEVIVSGFTFRSWHIRNMLTRRGGR